MEGVHVYHRLALDCLLSLSSFKGQNVSWALAVSADLQLRFSSSFIWFTLIQMFTVGDG